MREFPNGNNPREYLKAARTELPAPCSTLKINGSYKHLMVQQMRIAGNLEILKSVVV